MSQQPNPKYIPLGTRVLLHALPIEQGLVALPDGAQSGQSQRLRVEGVGPAVNDEKWNIQVGDIVQLCNHPGSMSGVEKEAMLLTVDRTDINVIVKEARDGE
jgi:hypothetical protein